MNAASRHQHPPALRHTVVVCIVIVSLCVQLLWGIPSYLQIAYGQGYSIRIKTLSVVTYLVLGSGDFSDLSSRAFSGCYS